MTTVIRVPMLVMSVSNRRPTITETMVVDMDKEHVAANFAIVETLSIVSVTKINVEMDNVLVLTTLVLSFVEMIVVNIKILMMLHIYIAEILMMLHIYIVEKALMVNCVAKTKTVRMVALLVNCVAKTKTVRI